MNNIILNCQNLEFSYQDNGFKLDIKYLEIEKEKTLSIIGENGAGKTTLLKLMAFLEKPLKGIIHTQLHRREMTMVFQEPHLLNTTVERNIASGLIFRNFDKTNIKKKLEPYLEIFKLKDIRKKHAFCVSRGQAQRVALARALVLEPKLLLLDEPFSNIDFKDKDTLIDILKGTLITKHTTCVFVSQNLEEIKVLSDKKIILEKGKIIHD